MNTLTAAPTKIKRTGQWGARINATNVQVGDRITIRTRAGKTWDAEVTEIVWTGDDVTVAATRSLDRPAHRTTRPAAPRRRRGCPECGNPAFNGVDMCLKCFHSPF